MRATIALLVLTMLLCLAASLAAADGCFVPPRAFPTAPRIPGQSAIILFDGKQETLVVESTMQTDADGTFAWILPLPAEPTRIEATTPGALETLRMNMGPRIATAFEYVGQFFLLSILLFGVHGICDGFMRGDNQASRRAVELLVVAGVLAVLAGISVGGPAGRSSFSADQLSRRRVGNYDVAVLRARSSAEIEEWTKANGFADLPTGATAAIDDYARRGWVFAVSRLEKIGDGALSAHPLSVTFPTSEAVYPMRLTAMAASDVDVALYVFGTSVATHPLFETDLATSIAHDKEWRGEDRTLTCLNLLGTGRILAHPWLTEHVAGLGSVTALHGRLTPDQMEDDIVLSWKPGTGIAPQEWKTLHTPAAAMFRAACRTMWGIMGLLPFLAFILNRMDKKSRWLLASPYLIAFVLLPIGMMATPMVEPGIVNTVDGWADKRQSSLGQSLRHVPSTDPERTQLAIMSSDEVRAFLLANGRNIFTGAPMREEDSPGNFTFRQYADSAPVVMLYAADGFPYEGLELETDGNRQKRR